MACLYENLFDGVTDTDIVKSESVEATGSAYTLQARATGDPPNGTVWLQGSLDGVTWGNVTNVDAIGGNSENTAWVKDYPVKYLRLHFAGFDFSGSFALYASLLVSD